MKEKLKNYLVCGILGLLVFLTVLSGTWERAEPGFYDTWFNLRGKEDPGKEIAIVAMDEKSIEKLGPLPWSRQTHARLLEQLREAKAVGFDLLFDAPTSRENDAAFAAAVQKHGRVVLASMFAFEQDEKGEWLQQLKMPLPQLAGASAGLGFINMPADRGRMVRSVTVVDTNTFERPYPSFSLALTLAAAGLTPDDLIAQDESLRSESSTCRWAKPTRRSLTSGGRAAPFPLSAMSMSWRAGCCRKLSGIKNRPDRDLHTCPGRRFV